MANKNGNALIIYGGGLCPLANVGISVASTILKESGKYDKVFVGFNSFLSLTNDTLIKEWNNELRDRANLASGGFFGTCRNVDLTNQELREKAIEVCKMFNIRWVYVGGGDGSARQVAEIAYDFSKFGINFVFFLPFTIDGIEGGWSVGLEPAVAVSLYCINQTTSTFLRTVEKNRYSSAVIELQGRNRDDILVSTLKALEKQEYIADYSKSDVEVIALPANIPWSRKALISKVRENATIKNGLVGKPVLYILSEGAPITRDEIVSLNAENGVKARYFTIGHLSQMNDFLKNEDKEFIEKKIREAFELILHNLNGKPFSVVFKSKDAYPRIEEIDYFASRNPRQAQQQQFTEEDRALLEKYMP